MFSTACTGCYLARRRSSRRSRQTWFPQGRMRKIMGMGTGVEHKTRPARIRRRRFIFIPLAFLCILAIGLGYLFATAEAKPSVQLGAPGEVPGGIAMITGIVPVELDGWQPPSPVAALQQGVQEGAHRVRIEVQFTAMEPGGLRLDPAGFIVDGLGSGRPGPLWSSPRSHSWTKVNPSVPRWFSNCQTRRLPWFSKAQTGTAFARQGTPFRWDRLRSTKDQSAIGR